MSDTYKERWEAGIEKRFDRLDADQLRQRNTLTQLEAGQRQLKHDFEELQRECRLMNTKMDEIRAVVLPPHLADDLQAHWHRTKLHADRMELLTKAMWTALGTLIIGAVVWAAKQGAF